MKHYIKLFFSLVLLQSCNNTNKFSGDWKSKDGSIIQISKISESEYQVIVNDTSLSQIDLIDANGIWHLLNDKSALRRYNNIEDKNNHDLLVISILDDGNLYFRKEDNIGKSFKKYDDLTLDSQKLQQIINEKSKTIGDTKLNSEDIQKNNVVKLKSTKEEELNRVLSTELNELKELLKKQQIELLKLEKELRITDDELSPGKVPSIEFLDKIRKKDELKMSINEIRAKIEEIELD